MRRGPLLWALFFFGLVAVASALRPPQPASPFARVTTTDGVTFSVLLDQQPTLSACRATLSALKEAICQSNPDCDLRSESCLVSINGDLNAVRSNAPLAVPSLRFPGGDIVFEGPDSGLTLPVCRSLEKSGQGRCFDAGQIRDANLEKIGVGRAPFQMNFSWTKAMTAFVIGFLVSLAVALGIVLTGKWHGRFTFDGATGVQKFHQAPTPRIGGLALLAGLIAALWWLPSAGTGFYTQVAWPLMGAASIAFVFGFLEDVTGRIGVMARLVATMASTVLAWWLMGISLQSVGIDVIDMLLAITFVSVLVTAIAIGGVANAINIIDGFHGLAGGVVILILAGLAFVAHGQGDLKLMLLSLMVIAVILGFLVLNTPFGKIFLGDGGAYLLGFLVGWIALLLPARNPDVSPWASLLICAYPVTEVLFSIYRRIRLGVGVGDPDRAHLHSLIKLAVVMPRSAHISDNRRNASVAPYLWLLAALPIIVAVLVPANTEILMVSFVVFCVVYAVIYRRLSLRAKELQIA